MIEGQLDTIYADCVVVGGGIAGCWAALKLQSENVKTVLIYYGLKDRGGKLGSTELSVGAINTSPLTRPDYKAWVHEMGRGQVQNSVCQVTQELLEEELEELKQFDALKPINLGVALKSGSGRHLTNDLLNKLEQIGCTVIHDGWVTKLCANETRCDGLQYQIGRRVGSIVAGSMVLASGGYSSLFHGSVKTGTYGSIHGKYLEAGGQLSNTEFIFKHGYGQPDLGKLTPTEELPGVEIYDEDGVHLQWLEEELFYGRGTNNHFQAFMTWRKSSDKKYFVDFRFRDFNKDVNRKLKLINSSEAEQKEKHINELLEYVVDQSNAGHEEEVREIFKKVAAQEQEYSYQLFCDIKALISESFKVDKNRIRQISYFSMGGVMHHQFKTNLKNVFVSGEAMHDYGAHRVGGLPWALYLCSSRVIAEEIIRLKQCGRLQAHNFPIVKKIAHFDADLLETVQMNLQKYQENGVDEESCQDFIGWLRRERLELIQSGRELDDAVAYLMMAEAIMVSSLARKESRGCFFRQDFSNEEYDYGHHRSVAVFDKKQNRIFSKLIHKSHILNLVSNKGEGHMKLDTASKKLNASYTLLKKHSNTPVWEKTAVEMHDRALSYQELNQLVDKYAHYLFTKAIVKGDRVALLLNDSPDLIALFLACMQIGAIAVPLNTFCKNEDLIHYLLDSGSRLLISEDSLLKNYDFGYVSSQTDIIAVSVDDLEVDEFDSLSSCVSVDETTPGFLLYTSGSTGKPKAALHYQVSLAKTAETFAQSVLNPTYEDRFYSTSKIFFAYGLGNSVSFPLYFGATTIVNNQKITPDLATQYVDKKQPTLFFSVPALYKGLIEQAKSDSFFSSVRKCVSAGEALPEVLARNWFDATEVPLIDGIGSTEALHIFCTSDVNAKPNPYRGKPVPGYDIRLMDDSGFEVEDDVVANLMVKGPSLANGYWQNNEATKTVFKNGWLKTGDRYQRNERGEFLFVGRTGDTYKSSGLWVSAREVEDTLNQLDFVQDAAIAVFKDTDGFFKAKAYLVVEKNSGVVTHPTANQERVIETVKMYLNDTLSAYKHPHYFGFLDCLPRTATGKVAKSELRARAIRECALAEIVDEAISAIKA